MSEKISLGPMNAEEAAKFLRQAAEATHRHSQNWDNFEQIARDMFSAALAQAKETE